MRSGVKWILLIGSGATQLALAAPPPGYYFGADLSFVNELEDCGAKYSVAGKQRDPYELLHEKGRIS